MKRTFAAIAIAMTVAATPVFAAPDVKIGVVDLQRAVNDTKEGAALRAEIAKKTTVLNYDLKGLQIDFDKLKGELDKDGASMTAEKRAAKEHQLLAKRREFQKRQRDAQEEIKQLENDLVQELLGKFATLTAKIGEEGKYTLILDNSANVRYLGKGVDITPALIKKSDEGFAK